MTRIIGDADDDDLRGTHGGDRISGRAGDDTLRGNWGDDQIYGGDGDDLLRGGRDDDLLRGGHGNDTLVGGPGIETLFGGIGHDVFRFDDEDTGDVTAGPSADEILDFSHNDTIDLRAVDLLSYNYDYQTPIRGSFSAWTANGDTYVSWNTFGAVHDIKLTGYTGNVLNRIVWYDDDHGSTGRTATPIVEGETLTGTIEVDSDSDRFRITLEQGKIYTVDLRGESSEGGTLRDPALQLYDQRGRWEAGDYNSGQGRDDQLLYVPEEDSTFYIAASSDARGVGTYTLSVSARVYEDDHGNNPDTASSLELGATVTGGIDVSGDSDWFAITLIEGERYAFDLRGNDSGSGTLPDPLLELANADGEVIRSNDDGPDSLDSHLTYTATTSGTYYLVARELVERTGTYELSSGTTDETRDDLLMA